MKQAKHLSTISKKLTSVPELPYKKGLLNSSPKLKEKRNAKTLHKIEPMVLRSPPTGESVVRYALPIPLSKTKELIAEDEMMRIAQHLKTVVCTLEDTYGAVNEGIERTGLKPKQEDSSSLSIGDDMNAFLLCCSQFAAQLEEAVKEERNILESLFKWFQQQVNQIEEISKDQSILEADLPSDGKLAHFNMAQIVKLIQKLEELKNRLRDRRGQAISKYIDKETLPASVKSYERLEKQMEDFIKSHPSYESQIISETEPETPYSMNNRMKMMIKIFENQANMLERALNNQSIIETKYKKMEVDFQVLSLEKSLLESEIQKIRESERAKPTSKEVKKHAKSEKKKDKVLEGKLSSSKEIELLQIQKEAESLKMEKKALQEQLKWALQEAERNKMQLDHVLHQEMEMLKEERSKTRLERAFSRTRPKNEDSRHSLPAEKDEQSGGQRQDHDQISPGKSKRLADESLEKRRTSSAVLESSNLEGFYGVSDVPASLPEIFKSFTAMPLIEEQLDSTSPQEKETEMWSLVSFPNLTEEIEKDEAPEQILSHTEAEHPEDSSNIFGESSGLDDKDLLPEDEAPSMKQVTDKGKRKPFYITTKKPESLSLISRTQSEIENLEAIKHENWTNEHEEQSDKGNSKTEIKLKRPKGSKTGKLNNESHEVESDRVVSEESRQAKFSAKEQDTAQEKGLISPDEVVDGSLSPLNQGSVSKVDTQTKKQRIHKRGRHTSNEMPDKIVGHQDAGLKSEIHAKKLKFFKSENISDEIPLDIVDTEVSDRNIRLEDQNAQSSSQVQLKKQKSFRRDKFTRESYAHLHQESLLEAKAEVERGTTSEDWRFTRIPFEHQRRELSVDNLVPEKKPLLITVSPTQSKKYLPSWDDNAETQNKSFTEIQEISEHQTTLNPIVNSMIFQLDMDRVLENDIERLKETIGQHILRSEVKTRSKSGLDISTDKKGMPEKSKLKDPVKTELKSKEDAELSTIKGIKLFGKPNDQHNMTLSQEEDISTVVSSFKTKPQENINAQYHPLKKFPTKVVNLSPFITQDENKETSSPYENVIPKPFYRTSRGSSLVPTAINQFLNRRTLGDPKSKNVNKQDTELESQLYISTTSAKKYVHKGQTKWGKLKKKAEFHSNLRPSPSSIKKQQLKVNPKPAKLDERGVEFPNNLKTSASTPKIKVIKELFKTSNLDEDSQLSNNLPRSKSAAKKPEIEEQPKSVNLNDNDAIILYNLRGSISPTNKGLSKELSQTTHFYEAAQRSSVMHASTSATRKPEIEETSKTTNLDKKDVEVANNLQMSNLAAIVNTLKEPSKPSNLDKKANENVDFLHMSASALIKYFLKESSKTHIVEKKRSKGSNSLHKSTSSVRKLVDKEPSKTKNLGKNVAEGTRLSASAKKKPGLKDLPKPTNLNDKGAQLLGNLHISGSAKTKKVLKGQPKPTLDKKGVDLSNNLVLSTSVSIKRGLKGKPKSENRWKGF